MTRYVLAVDAGGSKCDAVLVAEDGRVAGWGRFQQTGVSGRSRAAVQAAVERAVANLEGDAELHLVGIEESVLPRSFFMAGLAGRACRVARRLLQVTEYTSALTLAGHDCGLVALAGTGSFVYGRTRDGRVCHLDGLGPVLGDEGSAYDIGYRALRAVAKGMQRLRHATSLQPRIFQRIRELFPDKSLISFSLTPMDRSVLASFARLVDEEAEAGDAVARSILRSAADSLAETVRDVVEYLGIATEPYVMVGTGGVINGSRLYWEHLVSRVHEFAPRLDPRRYPWPPVLGAVLAGLARLRNIRGEALHPLATVVRCSFEAFQGSLALDQGPSPPVERSAGAGSS